MEFFDGRIMDDVLDSRDVVGEAAELYAIGDMDYVPTDAEQVVLNLNIEGRYAFGDEDWENGVPLIRDSYFTEYAQEFAEDMGLVDDRFYEWPHSHINWQSAAEALQQDYTMLCVDGVTWWGRA